MINYFAAIKFLAFTLPHTFQYRQDELLLLAAYDASLASLFTSSFTRPGIGEDTSEFT